RSLFDESDFFGGFETTQGLYRGGSRNGGLIHKASFHEFSARNRSLAGTQALNGRRKIRIPSHRRIDLPCQELAIPGVRKDDRNLIRPRQCSHGMRSEEIEVDQRAKEIFSPAVTV